MYFLQLLPFSAYILSALALQTGLGAAKQPYAGAPALPDQRSSVETVVIGKSSYTVNPTNIIVHNTTIAPTKSPVTMDHARISADNSHNIFINGSEAITGLKIPQSTTSSYKGGPANASSHSAGSSGSFPSTQSSFSSLSSVSGQGLGGNGTSAGSTSNLTSSLSGSGLAPSARTTSESRAPIGTETSSSAIPKSAGGKGAAGSSPTPRGTEPSPLPSSNTTISSQTPLVSVGTGSAPSWQSNVIGGTGSTGAPYPTTDTTSANSKSAGATGASHTVSPPAGTRASDLQSGSASSASSAGSSLPFGTGSSSRSSVGGTAPLSLPSSLRSSSSVGSMPPLGSSNHFQCLNEPCTRINWYYDRRFGYLWHSCIIKYEVILCT